MIGAYSAQAVTIDCISALPQGDLYSARSEVVLEEIICLQVETLRSLPKRSKQ